MRYGPIIVLSSLFGLAVSFAPIFTVSMGVFLKPLIAEFGWTRTQMSSGTAAAVLSLAIAAPILGRMMDRVGPRRLIIFSTIFFSIAVAALSLMPPSYPIFLILTGAIGLAGAGTTPLAYLALVARWFDHRLGLALGVTMVGIGIGMALSPIISQALMEHFGWRGAYLGLAAIAALGIPNAIFILREPLSIATAGDSAIEPTTKVQLRDILRTRTFWALATGVLLMTLVVSACGVHLIALLTDRGYTTLQAAQVASAVGVALLIGRLATGFLLDHLPVGALSAALFLIGGAGVLLLCSGASGSAAILAAIMIGFAQGAEGDIIAYAIRRCFGLQAYGITYGSVFAAFNLGAFLGPILLALAFDRFGSYETGLIPMVGVAVVAAILMLFVRPQPQVLASQ